jgi:hypothetical protein
MLECHNGPIMKIDSVESKDLVILEGPLEKRGFWNPAWKHRHFRLTMSGMMSYFPSSHCRKPLGSFSIREAAINRPANGHTNINVLVREPGSPCTGRTFFLAASSQHAAELWLAALRKAAADGYSDDIGGTRIRSPAALRQELGNDGTSDESDRFHGNTVTTSISAFEILALSLYCGKVYF